MPLPKSAITGLAEHKNFIQAANGQWTAFHFLYADCPCSRRILEHVLTRTPHHDACEKIVLIGGSDDLLTRVKNHQFEVIPIAPEQLKAKYGVEATPLLVVVNRQGQIRYAGGYTARKQAFDIKDTAILSDLIAGRKVEAFPLYGCAVSKSLQTIVDPLRIKPSSRD